MALSTWTLFILMLVFIIIFFISIMAIANYILKHFIERDRIATINRRRNNRIIPLETLIRLTQLRRMGEQRYVINNHAEVMTELKNKIIVINPDNSMSLGTEN